MKPPRLTPLLLALAWTATIGCGEKDANREPLPLTPRHRNNSPTRRNPPKPRWR